MKFNFIGNLSELKAGIEIFTSELKFECSQDGEPINISKSNGNIEVAYNNGRGMISYNRKIHFFRALGLFIEAYQNGEDFIITEKPQFEMSGIFFDCSRNAVPKVDSLKKFLRIMAIMGLDTIMLYLEDTYTIEDLPYFGYMRGRYTYNELKECDDYAYIFGIEITPYIQVLGHLYQALKWSYAEDIRDTNEILLAGCEKTYKFIEKMIESVMSPLRTKKIGIGIDEAYNTGLGKYLALNGYKDSLEIVSEHLDKVLKIVSSHNLIPYIPSDMYLNMASKTNLFYDAEDIPQYIIDKVPAGVRMVYWDYYHEDEEYYTKMLLLHKKLGNEMAFCGGITLWQGMAVNYKKTFSASNAGLNVCKREGITQVFAAMFGDDGSESNYFGGLLGMQLYAEHAYIEELDMNKLERRFKFCTGGVMDAFLALGEIDEPDKNAEQGLFVYNPSKYMLYQDVLIGLFDKHLEGLDTSGYYKCLGEKLEKYADENPEWCFVFDTQRKLCSVLELKADIGIRIKESYDNKDFEKLKKLACIELPELYRRVEELKNTHRKQWMDTYKPFGWEVLDIRYGGIMNRLNTAQQRINDYIEDKITNIEELDEKRLYFDESVKDKKSKICGGNSYTRTVTGGVF